MASLRKEWERRISELIVESRKHNTTYFELIGNFGVYIHPTVYSPKYFPETLWYGENLPSIIQGKSFLESALARVSFLSAVAGVDINPDAVQITQKNFEANHQVGTFVLSDIFDSVSGTYDFIFWNHPWQIDATIPQELKSEKTFDEGYRLLKRFVAQAKGYLTDNGSILLGTSYYADLASMVAIYAANGYTHDVLQQGQRSIGNGVREEYYIVQLRQKSSL